MTPRSIRNRLILSLVAALALITVLAGIGLYAFMEEVLERELDTAMAAKVDAIVESIRIDNAGQLSFRNTSSTPVHRDSPYYFQVLSLDGHVLAESMPVEFAGGKLPRPRARRHFSDDELPDGTDVRVTERSFLPQREDDDTPPNKISLAPLTLVIAHDLRSLQYTLAMLLSGLVISAAVLTSGMLLIVSVGVRRGLRPLDAISQQADRVGPQSMQLRFPAPAQLPDEIAPIAGKLNDLMDRLQDAFERERRFSAAVAHELRTPITELRSLCEVALRWPDPSAGGAGSPDTVTEALAIATDMSSLVESLLRLTKCQAGVERPATEPVDLTPLLEPLLIAVHDAKVVRNITVDSDAKGTVITDREMLKIVCQNLVGNAAAYCADGGRIYVHSVETDGRVSLTIGNTTAQLTADDLPHLTEPFWRKDAARTGSAHAGLGLSIVDAYCQVLRVPMTVALPTPQWFAVTLTLAIGR